MRTTYNLPEEITLPTGETLKPVIGGHLNQEPFCDTRECYNSEERQRIISEAKRRKLKYRVIGVLSRNLRGKYDLHGSLYRPNVWTFVEVSNISTRIEKHYDALHLNKAATTTA